MGEKKSGKKKHHVRQDKQSKQSKRDQLGGHGGQEKPGEIVYPGRFIQVRMLPVKHPDGRESRYEIVDHADAVAIVAVRYDPAEGRGAEPLVALVGQQRPAIGKATLEIPAGIQEESERDRAEVTAARELREETGYTARTLRKLAREYSSPGFTTEVISIYLATDLEAPAGGAVYDPAEIEHVRWLPLREALDLCRSGEIEDGKTIIGLWLARDALAEG
jgi:ADP-ribose pyrophosphatase